MMVLEIIREGIKHALGRRAFPPQITFILESPLRRILITPLTLANRLHLSEASRVLEVGCGSGVFSVEVAKHIPRGHLELLDLQFEMLAKAKRKVEAASLSRVVSYTQGNATTLPFAEDAFDIAFLVTVLGEVAVQQECLQELYRVIRRGGILSITEHLPDTDFSRFSRLRVMVEGGGFIFLERFGRPWSYTANFRRPA